MEEPKILEVLKDSSKMYTLVRGSLATFTGVQMKRLQELLSESKEKELQGIINSARLSHNFSGIMYSLRTNRPILIRALSFWGPFAQEKESYQVKIIFTQFLTHLPSDNTNDEVVLERFEAFVEAENSKAFLVQCPTEVRVEEGKWVRIRFQINGADTCVCSSVSNYYYLKDSDTAFEFFDSSHQIPRIHFQIPE